MTASRVRAALQAQPTAEALLASEGPVHAGELLRRSDAIARELAGEPGSSIALELDNGALWVAGALAVLRAERACVPVPQFFSAEQRAHAARAADVQIWLSASPQPPLAAADPPWTGRPLDAGLWCWTRRSERSDAAALPPRTRLITFTSGTTGRPKGVCLAQETLESVATSLAALARELELRRHLCALPLSLLLEHVAGIYAPLLAGIQSVVLPLARLGWRGSSALDLRRLLSELRHWQPDSVILVPELLHGLVCALEQGAPRVVSLRFVAVGGGRVSPHLLERAAAVGLPVYEGYGLSECASVVALNRPGRVRPGCVGEPLPHARLELASDGEVIVHGPCMEGYLGEAPLPVPGRWATGDIGHLEGGFLELRGRKRNVFITSHGRNVSPEWVESELAQTAPIAQAAVFGEARPRNLAVLVPRQPSQARSELLAAIETAVRQVNARLPDYARVGAWVLSEQPFSAANGLATDNGRIRREAIEARHAAALQALVRAEHTRGESACPSTTA
jgi:long-chain acyl-CoA synthetase